jgi:ribosomal-protein-alanine N-acetyltransferase
MLTFEFIENNEQLNKMITPDAVTDFLYEHLDRFRDSKIAISKALDYTFSPEEGKGGFLLLAKDESELVGVLVMNKTGMTQYIPENILVYVAVKKDRRGQGFGGQIVKEALQRAKGPVALHVEYDNPAKRLYERLGFTTKYAEMRYMPQG